MGSGLGNNFRYVKSLENGRCQGVSGSQALCCHTSSQLQPSQLLEKGGASRHFVSSTDYPIGLLSQVPYMLAPQKQREWEILV